MTTSIKVFENGEAQVWRDADVLHYRDLTWEKGWLVEDLSCYRFKNADAAKEGIKKALARANVANVIQVDFSEETEPEAPKEDFKREVERFNNALLKDGHEIVTTNQIPITVGTVGIFTVLVIIGTMLLLA